jgi:hypothetical protein
MFSGLNPIESLYQSQSGLFGAGPMDLSTDFNSIYNSLLTQKNSISAESAKRAYLQAQFAKRQALFNMFADPKESFLGFGISNMFGVGGPFGLPSWTYDASRLLGDSQTQNLIDLSQQAALLTQSRFGSLGSLDGGDIFSSLV